MNERLLQYIWQYQHYNTNELKTTGGEVIRVLQQGQFNRNQGPDFLGARIQLNGNTWIGHIELHVFSSDWYRHMHHEDENYRNVILHVVWQDDVDDEAPVIPTLVLQERIPGLLIHQYQRWMENQAFIPCGTQGNLVNELTWIKWKERLLMERWKRKGEQVCAWLDQNGGNWEETLWWMVARSFGLVVNADAFTSIAMSLPYRYLVRHSHQIQQVEALLLGQAGLLQREFADKYAVLLKKEYFFLRDKYRLRPSAVPLQFLRMRPPSFPTVRLAQLAMFIHRWGKCISTVIHADQLIVVRNMLDITANDYWHYRYVMDEESQFAPKKLGMHVVNGILINGVLPFMYAFGEHYGREHYNSKAVEWLQQLAAEKNTLTKGFTALGVPMRSAFDSQALLELKTHYCDTRRCLDCSVGRAILVSGEW